MASKISYKQLSPLTKIYKCSFEIILSNRKPNLFWATHKVVSQELSFNFKRIISIENFDY
jgi:hypothetical protein